MMICSVKGFELLGGGINIPAMILCVVIDLVAVYFAHKLAVTVSIMQELDYGFGQSYKYIPFLLEYSEFSTAYYKDLAMGYGLTAVAVVPSVINMFKGKKRNE